MTGLINSDTIVDATKVSSGQCRYIHTGWITEQAQNYLSLWNGKTNGNQKIATQFLRHTALVFEPGERSYASIDLSYYIIMQSNR